MIETKSLAEPKSERRQALAKVYRLLIMLVEESKNNAAAAGVAGASNEKLDEPKAISTETLS